MAETIYYRKNGVLPGSNRILTVINFLLLLLFLHSCNNKSEEIRILFTGDILLSRNVRVEIESRKISPWTYMGTTFHDADLVIGNLEGAVVDSGVHSTDEPESPIFNIEKSLITVLSQAGFNVLSVENNHSHDFGERGKAATIKELCKSQITPVYYDNSPHFFNINKTVIAIVAINLIPGKNNFQKIPSLETKQKLKLARKLANMVVVFIHWGSELLEWPNRNQRIAAKWLINNGADLIIGSHPHVIQYPEIINGKPVFYSLGNHVFDQKYLSTKEGLIVDCRIRNGNFKCEGIITHTKKNSFFPEITRTITFNLPSVTLSNSFKISNISLQPISTPDGLLILNAFHNNGKKLWQSHPIPIVSIEVGKLDSENDYLMIIEKHYSNMDGEIGLRPYVYSIEKSGITAKWRGSALAFPLLDAKILSENNQILCALHRGDSFIKLNPDSVNHHIAAYRWNGFGFTGINDEKICKSCLESFKMEDL